MSWWIIWFCMGFVAGAYIWHKGFRDKVNGYIKKFFSKKRS